LLAIAVTLLSQAGCSGDKSATDDAAEEEAAIPVEIAVPVRADVHARYSGTAPIEAFADALVIAKVAGEVREILVEEGDDVVQNQVLARLDGDRLRLEKEQAEANLRKLQGDYQRNIELRDKGLISEGDFDKLRYELDALKASYDLAALELDYTEIRSPIDGVVSARLIKLGNTIDVNAPTFKVTTLEPLVSYLHVPEREYRRIDRGQAATITIDALSGVTFEAQVARVSPVVDPDTGTFKITVEVSDPTRRLKPGMFARIDVVHDTRKAALVVPRAAVLEEGGRSLVFVVNDGTAEKREVTTGYSEGGNVEIRQGLNDSDQIVTVGHTNLKDGSRVNVIGRRDDSAEPAPGV